MTAFAARSSFGILKAWVRRARIAAQKCSTDLLMVACGVFRNTMGKALAVSLGKAIKLGDEPKGGLAASFAMRTS